jgi:hypothetical protein
MMDIPFRVKPRETRRLPLLLLRQFPSLLLLTILAKAWIVSPALSQAAEPVVLEVHSGKHDRESVPVSCEVPKGLREAAFLKLTRADNGKAVAVQIERSLQPKLVWMIDDKMPASSNRRYLLTAESPVQGGTQVTVTMGKRDLLLAVGERPVLRYQHALMPSADPEMPCYSRSGFIHPVYDPHRRMLTDSMPPDHMHQHGLMFAWVNTTFEGRTVDFWNSKKKLGEIRHVALEGMVSGPVLAGFMARLDHIDLTAPSGPKTVLHEIWQVRVYNRADGFLFDLRSTQTCAETSPLVLNKYEYGGMCIRGNSAWLEPEVSSFLTSDGKDRKAGNHSRPRWVDLTGRLEGQASGMTVFCHPSNFRFPLPVRLHPTKPYFCWAPMVLGSFSLEPGKPYVSAYRFFVHSGKPDVALTERLWNDYADPAQVRIVTP